MYEGRQQTFIINHIKILRHNYYVKERKRTVVRMNSKCNECHVEEHRQQRHTVNKFMKTVIIEKK